MHTYSSYGLHHNFNHHVSFYLEVCVRPKVSHTLEFRHVHWSRGSISVVPQLGLRFAKTCYLYSTNTLI